MPHGIDDQFGHGQTDGLSSLRHDSQRHHIDTQNPVIAIDAEGVSECVTQAAQVVAQIDFREQTGSLPSGMERGMDLSHGGDTCARNRESLATSSAFAWRAWLLSSAITVWRLFLIR